MAEAGVAHFQRRFGDIVFALTQQFSRSFESCLAEELLDSKAGGLGELPAQVERTAPHQPAQLLQRRRIGRAVAQALYQLQPPAADRLGFRHRRAVSRPFHQPAHKGMKIARLRG